MSTRMPDPPLGPLSVAEYAAKVRRALQDLPPDQLEDLLEDLPGHLAETAADDGDSLRDRLGSPADYAAELRAAAGLPAGHAGGGDVLRDAAQRFRRHDSVRAVLDFLPELRPAWWVLRPWLILAALSSLLAGVVLGVPFGLALGLPMLVAATIVSVRLGRRAARRPPRSRRQQLVILAGNAGLALLAVVVLVGVQQRGESGSYAYPYPGPYPYGLGEEGEPLRHSDGAPITNIYPYTADGRPLTGILLYDQDGRSVDNVATRTRTGLPIERIVTAGSPPTPANAFPQRQRVRTDAVPGAPTPDPAPALPPAVVPGSSATPTATLLPTGAPPAATTPQPTSSPRTAGP